MRKEGILLINTGTPDSPDPDNISSYLEEFLSDRNLIDVPAPIWHIILHAFILKRRPSASAKKYQKIWTKEGSPFLLYSLSLRDKLQAFLDEQNEDVDTSYVVEYGSRYGNPSIKTSYDALVEKGCSHITSIPLFPQTAFSTTKTCKEAVENVAQDYPHVAHRCIEGYSDNPLYIEAMANLIKQNWSYKPGSKLLFTFHSIPCKHVKKGDTYVAEIEQSMTALAHKLGIPRKDWEITFHSRFEDSRKWIGPNIYTVMQVLAQQGADRVAIVAPGFCVDCLETLLDCKIVQCQFFEKACADEGLTADSTYIPALNDNEDLVRLLADLAQTK